MSGMKHLAATCFLAALLPTAGAADFKASLAQMPDGELIMVAFYPDKRPDGTYHEPTALWRSISGMIAL